MAFTELEGANRATPAPRQPTFGESLARIPERVQASPEAQEAVRTNFLRGLLYNITGQPDNLDPAKGVPREVSTSELSPEAKAIFDKLSLNIFGLNGPRTSPRGNTAGEFDPRVGRAEGHLLTTLRDAFRMTDAQGRRQTTTPEEFWDQLLEVTGHEMLHAMDFGVGPDYGKLIDRLRSGVSSNPEFKQLVWDMNTSGYPDSTPEEVYAYLPTRRGAGTVDPNAMANFYSWILNERARPAR